MNCSPDIANILLAIIKEGLLRIRNLAGDYPQRASIEADHLHNLPDLLMHYSPDLLKFYWEVERTAFVDQSNPEDLIGFQSAWQRLGELIAREVPMLVGGRK